jgi:hypothetical protein
MKIEFTYNMSGHDNRISRLLRYMQSLKTQRLVEHVIVYPIAVAWEETELVGSIEFSNQMCWCDEVERVGHELVSIGCEVSIIWHHRNEYRPTDPVVPIFRDNEIVGGMTFAAGAALAAGEAVAEHDQCMRDFANMPKALKKEEPPDISDRFTFG